MAAAVRSRVAQNPAYRPASPFAFYPGGPVPVMSVRAPIRWRMMLSVSTATARKSPPRARMAAAFFMRLLCRFAVFTLSFDRAFVFRAQPFCQEVDGMDRRSLYNLIRTCLLYTSDAADDLLCVDLGGRRIIKKKNTPSTT